MIDDVASAIDDSVRRSGDPHVAFIPEGPYVVPVCRRIEQRPPG